MLTFQPRDLGRPAVVLGLAAHPDDLEIGCAATILQWQQSATAAPWSAHWVLMTGTPERVEEARHACGELLGDRLVAPLAHLGFRDGYLPAVWGEAKEQLAATLQGIRPDLVLVPSRDDAHQDHRLLAELAWQLCRGSTIWEYEIPKWDGDLGRPNTYVPITPEILQAKVHLLHRHYSSQHDKPWYDEQVFRGLARLRGMECGSEFAEAFTVRKTVVLP